MLGRMLHPEGIPPAHPVVPPSSESPLVCRTGVFLEARTVRNVGIVFGGVSEHLLGVAQSSWQCGRSAAAC